MRRFLRWFLRLTVAAALAMGLGYLPYKAYGPDGVPRALRLERKLDHLEQKNAKLRRENLRLQVKVKSLREDRRAIERVGRDELGLARPEDIIFLFE